MNRYTINGKTITSEQPLSDEEIDQIASDKSYGNQIEPGVYGETSPAGQKMLEMGADIAGNAALVEAPFQLYNAAKSLPKAIEAAKNLPKATSEAISSIKDMFSGKAGKLAELSKELKLPAPELPLGDTTSVKPNLLMEQFKTARKTDAGKVILGHGGTEDINATLLEAMKEEKVGNLAKAAELKSQAKQMTEDFIKTKGFVDIKGQFKTPKEVVPLLENNPAADASFSLERPFASTKSGISEPLIPPKEPKLPAEDQLGLFKRLPKKSSVTEPIKLPNTPSVLLPNAEKRIEELSKITTDINPKTPTLTRVELNDKMGAAKKAATEQMNTGIDQDMIARTDTMERIDPLLKLGIKPGSSTSKAIQMYGESPNRQFAANKIKEILGEGEFSKIEKAEQYMRVQYDQMLTKINMSRKINGLPEIQGRPDYFNHFSEISAMADLGLLGSKDTIATEQAVAKFIAELNKPSTTMATKVKDIIFRHSSREPGAPYVEDAVAGFERYLRSANNFVHMQPVVNELNATAKTLTETAPNTSQWMGRQAQFIAGGTQDIEKAVKNVLDVTHVNAFKALSRNFVKNLIQANPNVWLAQGLGAVPAFSTFGMNDFALATIPNKTNMMIREYAATHSRTVMERALDMQERAQKSGRIEKTLDAFGSSIDLEVVLHSYVTAFRSAIKKGLPLEDAAAKADEFAAMSNGLTSRMNTPAILRDSLVQSLAPFQNQVMAWGNYMRKGLTEGVEGTSRPVFAAKAMSAALAWKMINQFVTDKDKGTVSGVIPFGGTLESGIGGILSVPQRVLKAKTLDKAALEAAKGAMLLQGVIPAGLQWMKLLDTLTSDE